jgi:biotin carboxyl carrier protein
LPGTVISCNVKEGESVSAGQTLVVMEAMKMENNIDAEKSGVVKSINVQAGATVMEGEVLLVIE